MQQMFGSLFSVFPKKLFSSFLEILKYFGHISKAKKVKKFVEK